jgi:polysaccharide deacetylase 2 family uncharacterized protein YibQ
MVVLWSTSLHAASVSIIIDDVGDNRKLALRSLNLHPAVALSVLPHTPFSQEIATLAAESGNDIMLHQPMESHSNNHLLGPGPLLTSMDRDQLTATLRANLDSLPQAIGINNHMGSKLTEDTERMAWIMSVLISRGKFFIDSRTSAESNASDTAQLWHVPNMTRHVFLDHHDDIDFIAGQFERLIGLAKRHGHAIAIGHPKVNTLSYLEYAIPMLAQHGITLTPIREQVFMQYQPDFPPIPNALCYQQDDHQAQVQSLTQRIADYRCQYQDDETLKRN